MTVANLVWKMDVRQLGVGEQQGGFGRDRSNCLESSPSYWSYDLDLGQVLSHLFIIVSFTIKWGYGSTCLIELW